MTFTPVFCLESQISDESLESRSSEIFTKMTKDRTMTFLQNVSKVVACNLAKLTSRDKSGFDSSQKACEPQFHCSTPHSTCFLKNYTCMICDGLRRYPKSNESLHLLLYLIKSDFEIPLPVHCLYNVIAASTSDSVVDFKSKSCKIIRLQKYDLHLE